MRVEQLWRYPVKSVGGEPLVAAAVGRLGIDGDRVLAVRDERNEVTWAGAVPELMQVRAVTVGAGVTELILPDGRRLLSDAPDAADRLSAAVHAKVTLAGRQPDLPDLALHVLTTTALRSLASALPDSAIDATRFRPNLVLDGVPDERGTGYPEHGWAGVSGSPAAAARRTSSTAADNQPPSVSRRLACSGDRVPCTAGRSGHGAGDGAPVDPLAHREPRGQVVAGSFGGVGATIRCPVTRCASRSATSETSGGAGSLQLWNRPPMASAIMRARSCPPTSAAVRSHMSTCAGPASAPPK